PSVVPEEGLDGETGERRRRLLSEPAAAPETPADPAAPIKARRWWFRARSEPVTAGSDLAETEARQAAARSAAAELRSRLKSEGPVAPAAPPPAAEPEAAPPAATERPPPARRRRRTTELVGPPMWQRTDLLVLVVALVLFGAGAALHRVLAAPALVPVDELGLHLARPKHWLAPVKVDPPAAGLAAGVEGGASARPGPVLRHVVYQSAIAATARLEIRIAERPVTSPLRSALVLGRISRYGESFTPAESTERTIGGRDWIRTQYRYPFKAAPGDVPVIATAIELATLNGQVMYVVTLHGDEKTARRLEALLVPTLKVDPNHPAAVGRQK
ncbi:MAG TPA: hypothetical protein VFU21_13295, partial [Kofleriaceae bacterium]|nr:hypothetical protein [Kofleriaceae bacterium]